MEDNFEAVSVGNLGLDTDGVMDGIDEIHPIDDVEVCLRVVLGETVMPVHELLRLGRGAVIGLDSTDEDDVRIVTSNTEIAGGQLRLNGEQIEVIVTETRLRGEAYRPPSDPFKNTPEVEEIQADDDAEIAAEDLTEETGEELAE